MRIYWRRRPIFKIQWTDHNSVRIIISPFPPLSARADAGDNGDRAGGERVQRGREKMREKVPQGKSITAAAAESAINEIAAADSV